jgi:hypothetical protein
VRVAKVGRNEPCPCGSGVKAKRCCGVRRGPDPDELARVFLRTQADDWAPVLVDHTEVELQDVLHEVERLPEVDLSLHLRLPRLLPPALERFREAIAARDAAALEAVLPGSLEIVDTPTNREALARAVIALHDDGHRIPCDLAAAAILDLADEPESRLVVSALYHALALTVGEGTTPSGLVIGSRTSAA